MASGCEWAVDDALSVLSCESDGDDTAVSNGNYGLFQINAIHAWRVGGDLSLLLDPAVNVAVTCAIWLDWGDSWEPWACKPEVTP